MAREEITVILGGAQGAGLNTCQQVLTSAFALEGFGVIADREYFSNIKGRHSYVHTTISSSTRPKSLTFDIDLLGCMDAETVFTHFEDLKKGGYLVYDHSSSKKKMKSIPSIEVPLKRRLNAKFIEIGVDGSIESLVTYLEKEKHIHIVNLHYPDILDELLKEFELSPSQTSRYVSSILIGAVAGLVNMNTKNMNYGIMKKFGNKEKIAEQNRFLANYVSELINDEYNAPLELASPNLAHDEFMLVTGNELIGMAKIVGGLRFQSYYPITPAADESFFIEQHAALGENNVVVFQTEDELSAIGSAIGAALSGARSATATSGPGFSLMVEGLGWAAMNEVPVVITCYQRGGPSTGLPTRGSQADLLSTLHGSHGESPRIVLTSGDHEEAFHDGVEVFNLAEKYQTPVIHLLDKFLANSTVTATVPDISSTEVDRGELVKKEGLEDTDYKRFGEGPISKRKVLGSGKMWYTGSEHNEYGNVSEDPYNRMRMEEKRMGKLEAAEKNIPTEEMVRYYGPENADFLIVGWGSVKGVSLDTIEDIAKEKEKEGAYLHLKMFVPFPSAYVISVINRFTPNKTILVEHSYTAQAGKVIAMNTGITIEKKILKYTGRPIYKNELKNAIKKVLNGRKKVVLRHGP